MKTVIIILMSTIINLTACAQTWNEWFRQKNTQKKYLVQQIVALKVYLKYMKEGYDIAKKGLNMIGDIKDGNFNDHSTYFGSLRLVNEAIGNSPKISLIIVYQKAVIRDLQKLNVECRNSASFSLDEIEYIGSVHNNLLIECEKVIASLNTVITDDSSQMTDHERIRRINFIYNDMKDKYSFTRTFCNSARMLVMQRKSEMNEVESGLKLNAEL
jgi:hypothetical protein